MRKGGGKGKGSAFERVVCKDLSLWITDGEKEDCFWRSAMSGGRATVGRRGGKEHARHAGDISATSPEGHVLTDVWYVECKNVANLAITAALMTGAGAMSAFWREAVEQATAFKKRPMLIAKQDRQPTIVLVPSAHMLYPKALLGRLSILRADVLDYQRMLRLPFKGVLNNNNEPFLLPGELQRILNGPRKIKRERLPIIERLRL